MASILQHSKFQFSHPLLGDLTGVERSPDVVQFRTIPYARIPGRFRQSTLIKSLEEAERDCTEYGPACPQVEQDAGAFGGLLPGERLVHYDEFACLNLTVTVPKWILGQRERVPVLVHVHGGGFNQGSHTNGVRGTFFSPIIFSPSSFLSSLKREGRERDFIMDELKD
jgi:carboxylesterase type B